MTRQIQWCCKLFVPKYFISGEGHFHESEKYHYKYVFKMETQVIENEDSISVSQNNAKTEYSFIVALV